MRYWAFFAAKLCVCAALLAGALKALNHWWPTSPPRFGYELGYTVAAGVWFLFGCGLVYLAILDQRYRCRVCLRRLRMPVEIGSYSKMLQLGRPTTEYICTWGHGKLARSEVQISGLENPEWTAHGELWDELFAVSDREDRR